MAVNSEDTRAFDADGIAGAVVASTVTFPKPPQLRAARRAKQSVIKFVILFVTLAFLFVPLLAMLIFTLRHPLSGRWSAAPWIAIFTGNGESLGADLTVLWQGVGTSLALSAVTVVIIPAIVLVVGLGPIYRWLSADVLSTNPIWLCFAYVILVMPFAFRAIAVVLGEYTVASLLGRMNLQVALYQLGQSNSQISTAMSLLALLFGVVLLVALDLISDAMRKSKEGK